MARKKKSKSPFLNGTAEQIADAEATSFYIIVGDNIFTYNSQMTFTKDDAAFHYAKVQEFLQEIATEGSSKEKIEASKSLLTLKILPLRIN
jgi:hypothetical protein